VGIPHDPDSGVEALILLSHDCDIVHHDLTREPSAEFITMRRAGAPDGNLTHGKNPRRLHMDRQGRAVEFRDVDLWRPPNASRRSLKRWSPIARE